MKPHAVRSVSGLNRTQPVFFIQPLSCKSHSLFPLIRSNPPDAYLFGRANFCCIECPYVFNRCVIARLIKNLLALVTSLNSMRFENSFSPIST